MSGNTQIDQDLKDLESDDSSEDEEKPSFRKSSLSAPECCYCVEIGFETSQHAAWVLWSLELDPELRPQLVQRELEAHQQLFRATFRGKDAHVLRTAINAFYDALRLAIASSRPLPG
ncbi:hypothetical protein F1559_003871 [Cyanidiococcus yangmingshanensis]|uniref:Uncharacterized protein n=1 Tax=Cyanidiococcus yangmingshanensis TaxID=2690220 RepID=A0A7J7IGR4_9RHOD|nr:hypothetical protein F1559_003871 [Cyanidiococcus yangmingshanensis]